MRSSWHNRKGGGKKQVMIKCVAGHVRSLKLMNITYKIVILPFKITLLDINNNI